MTVLSPAYVQMISECARARLVLAPVAPHTLHLALTPVLQSCEGLACW